MARRGRPKRENVVRFPNGEIKQEMLDQPFNMTGVDRRVYRDETNREVTRFERSTALMRLFGLKLIDEHELEAGSRFRDLRDRALRLYYDAPLPHAKISSMERGFSHDPEQTEEMVEKGVKSNLAYTSAYRVVINCGTKVVIAVECVCLADTIPWRLGEVKKGLSALVEHFGLRRNGARVS